MPSVSDCGTRVNRGTMMASDAEIPGSDPAARLPSALETLKAIVFAFNEDKATRLAAAIAFSTMFSIAPLFIVFIGVAGRVLGGNSEVENNLVQVVHQNAGAATAQTVRLLIDSNFARPHKGSLAQAIAWIAFAFAASNLFSSLQDALNSIWRVESTTLGWKQTVRDRTMSFGMILVIGALLFGMFLANTTIAFVGAHFLDQLPVIKNPKTLTFVEQLVNFSVVTVTFALMYKVLPDVGISWRDVSLGAVVTALLFTIGEALISIYLAIGGVASAYGAAGSILVFLLWIYYSALIFLLGAEFTKVTAKHAKLLSPSMIRELTERPAGADPRAVPGTTA